MKFVQIQEVGVGEETLSESVLKRSLKHAINSLYERLRNENADFASVTSAYFRLDPSINWSSHREVVRKVASSLRKLASSRFPKAQCYLLFCGDFQHHLTTMNGKVPPNEATLIADIREEELRKLANESGALYEGNRFHLFRLPSGQTADFFFRTGNCLAKRESLHILAFWTLPSLETTNLIICDTWSISTLGMYLARLGERYTGRRYECQYLSKYLSEDITSSSEVVELLEQASDVHIAPIFLVSALSSGRSLRTYVEAFGTLFEEEKPFVVAMYLLGRSLAPDLKDNTDVRVLCSLADNLEARGLKGIVDDINLEEGQKIFTIDTQTYFPRYFEPKEHRFIPSKFTVHSKQFFETYAGRDIFAVCKDGSSNTKLNLRRHHAFHVDILKLVTSNEFRERVSKLINSLDRPTHIVHLKKPADAKFAQVVSECFPDDASIDLIECSGYRRIPKRSDILTRISQVAR